MTAFYKRPKEEQKIYLDKLQEKIDEAVNCFAKIMRILPIFRKELIKDNFGVDFKLCYKTFEFWVYAMDNKERFRSPIEEIRYCSDDFRLDVDGIKKALSDLENFCEKYNIKMD